jgi:imidazolonepropionase-like amidohydrolase
MRDATVVVEGTRITAVGTAASVRVPSGARVIDARGKYLIPGLWDMHAHLVVPGGRPLLSLYVANGVTGVRDMTSDWPTVRAWRESVRARAIPGPRILSAGPYLVGQRVPIPSLVVESPTQAEAAVDSLSKLGVDFVKVHNAIPRDAWFAAARAARAHGMTFAGHIPQVFPSGNTTVTAGEASDSGIRSIEHLTGIDHPCTAAEAEQLKPKSFFHALLGRCATGDVAPLFATLVRNHTWVTPTLVVFTELAQLPKHEMPADSVEHYFSDSLRMLRSMMGATPKEVPADFQPTTKRIFDKRVALVGQLHRAGVAILAGTDAPLRTSPPGFGLHDELRLLVAAGLSPLDALRAATLEPARYFAATDSLGTIERGKLADLVLLDADPLADIRNTRLIAAVVANGQLYDAAGRRALLAAVDSAARR